MRRTALPLLAGLLLLAGCLDRELPTASAPEGAAFSTYPVACDADPEARVAALIQAINTANANEGADEIDLAPGCTYTLISVNNPGSTGHNGLPILSGDLTIHGNGARIERSTAEETPTFRIFEISNGVSVSISGLTIANGESTGFSNGGGIYNSGTLTLTNSTVSGNTTNNNTNVPNGGGIYNSGTLTLTNSTVSGNTTRGNGGGIGNVGAVTLTHSTVSGNRATFGGGIVNLSTGTVTLTHSTVSGNTVETFHGGGIRNNGTMTLTHSIVKDNTARSTGGGISNASGSTMMLTNSTLSGNIANGRGGGGIWNEGGGTLTLTHSTLSGNTTPGGGGGIFNVGAVTLTHSTVSGNTASGDQSTDGGGGIRNNATGTLTLTHSTLSGNSAPIGAGIRNSGAATLRNSIIANSPAGGNCDGTITDSGYNLDSGTSCGFTPATGSLSSADPKLDPELKNNGGPTKTHALLAGSAAINAGDPNFSDPALPYDQRGDGFARVWHGRLDIGAFEFVCTAGAYYDGDAGACVLAPAGHYAELGDASATPCPLGRYQGATGQTSCLPAPIGTYVDVTGAAAPIPCPMGTTTQAVGSTSSAACVSTGFTFSGFFQPVENLPVVNVMQAGRAVPIKFSLGGNHGLNIFFSATPPWPRSVAYACDGSPGDPVEGTTTAGASSLSYDAQTDTYTYVWKTEKAWANSCRELTLKLSDGSEHKLHFQFRK